MEYQKISIVTVVFNGISTIEQTIKSVIVQNYPNLEYIIIDGGSTDGTINIIEKYSKHISFWSSEPDKGIYDAMNKGITKASGRVIAFLNSDDWYEEGTLNYINSCFKHNEEIICGNIRVHYDDRIYTQTVRDDVTLKDLFCAMEYPHPSTFIRKELFDKIGYYNLDYDISADYEWILRARCHGIKVMTVNRSLANFRLGGLSECNPINGWKEAFFASICNLDKLSSENVITKTQYYNILCEAFERVSNRISMQVYKMLLNDSIDITISSLSEVRKELNMGQDYSIFGCGKIGEECFNLFQALGLNIKNFYDNSIQRQGKFFHGVKTIKPIPSNLNDSIIIIASTAYQKEIVEDLEKMGLQKSKNYICYTDIRKKILKSIKDFVLEDDILK